MRLLIKLWHLVEIILLVLFFDGCGAPFDYDSAIRCSANVYIGRDVTVLDCPAALAAYAKAEQVTGLDLRDARVAFVTTVSDKTSWGKTWINNDVEVEADITRTLIHEAFHVRHTETDHCDWSWNGKIPLFEAFKVAGSFDDNCAHVRCRSTYWKIDESGQLIGGNYVCTPIP